MATLVQPHDKTVSVNRLKLHYLEWGAADRRPMVLLHGLRGHAHSWDDFSAAMCQEYRVLALDQRGRGESDWAGDEDYSTDAYVSDLAGFSKALALESYVLVGHSMGGRNAMVYASRHPEQVQKLVVVDVGPASDPRGAERIHREILGVPEEFESFEAVVAHMSGQNRYASDRVLRRRLKYATKELPNGKTGWRYDIAIREQNRQRTAPSPPDLWPMLKNITCPVLIVRGADTDLLPSEVAGQMLDVIPNSRLVEVAKAGHMVFEDNPEGYLEAVREFL